MPIEGNFYECKQKSRHGKVTTAYRCVLCSGRNRATQYAKDPKKSAKSVKKWRKKNPERAQQIQRDYIANHPEKYRGYLDTRIEKRAANRLLVLTHYSDGKPRCACPGCVEETIEFLSIDHIGGGGTRHRVHLKRSGSEFYAWLIEHKFPPGYRVLCHNCNHSYGSYGYCPHTREGSASLPADPSLGQ
jgi:hypothetical protein